MLLHVLVLSGFAAGMITVLLLSSRGGQQEHRQEKREDPAEPEELRAAT